MKKIRGSNCVQKCGPSYKKRRHCISQDPEASKAVENPLKTENTLQPEKAPEKLKKLSLAPEKSEKPKKSKESDKSKNLKESEKSKKSRKVKKSEKKILEKSAKRKNSSATENTKKRAKSSAADILGELSDNGGFKF